MTSFFRPHGSYSFEIEGSILIFKCKGPWNKEIVDEIEVARQPFIEELSKDLWGVLVIPYGEAIHTPESAQKSESLIKESKFQGRVCTAIMTNHIVDKRTTSELLQRIYIKCGEKPALFTDILKAKKWINKNIQEELESQKNIKQKTLSSTS